MRILAVAMGRLSAPTMGIALALACACGGGGEDGGPASLEAGCQERLATCFADPVQAAEHRGQCTLDDGRRDCILAAESCALVHGCYMGPLPDGSASTFCNSACGRCDLSCDAECASSDPCVVAAGSCDALAACLAGG